MAFQSASFLAPIYFSFILCYMQRASAFQIVICVYLGYRCSVIHILNVIAPFCNMGHGPNHLQYCWLPRNAAEDCSGQAGKSDSKRADYKNGKAGSATY